MLKKNNGTLWAAGSNVAGQLGDGTNIDKNVLFQVGVANDWQTLSAGYKTSAGFKSDGKLWVWGENSLVVLGDNTLDDKTCQPY